MKVRRIIAAACSFAFAGALALGLAGCNSEKIAATVGKTQITENEITDYIANFRESQGLTEDGMWALYLNMYGMTPETFREAIIDSRVNREVIIIAAQEKGMSVDPATIDEYVNKIKSNYSDDTAWQTALKNAGLTEEKYRFEIEYALLRQQLSDSFAKSDNPTDEQVLAVAKENAALLNGAKRSSHILLSADDEEAAQKVLEQAKAGKDFAELAKEYSTDSSSENGGDVGWDNLASFVPEYQTALDGLEKDQVSDLVKSQFGYHIIKCTDVFTAPENLTKLDQLPEAFQDFFKNLANTTTVDSALTTWVNAYKKNVDVKVNPMPEKLPYDIDTEAALAELYGSSSSSEGAEASDAAASSSASK